MSAKGSEKKIFDFSLLRRVFRFAAPYKKKFYISLALAILLAILSPIRPWLIQVTINDWVPKGAAATVLEKTGIIEVVMWITVIQVGLLLLEVFFRFYFSFLTAWLGQTVVKDLRVKVYRKVLGLNLSQFDTTPIGTLTTRTINDIEAINDIFAEGLIPIIADLLSIIAILVFMFWVDWRLTLISLAPFPFLIIATYYFKESVNKSFIRVRNAVASLNAFVQEHITGMGIVQAFAAEEREFNKFKRINKEHRNANIKAIFAYSVFFPLVEIVLAVGTGLMVWWAATHALKLEGVEAQSLVGKMISFYLCLNLLFRPLRVIADKFNVLQMGMVASERVFKVLDNDDYIKSEGNYAPTQVKGKIVFDHVSFAYVEDRYVLKDISFTALPGETIAIVGHTGSGKTSIISLLNRLYHIQKGTLTIDDVKIDEYKLDALRKNIGVVLQDVFLFSGSVLDNITLRNPAISREQVIAAAKMIDMHDFIMQLPGGYDYNVMERGSSLSLGQRQLLSFIRALLYNPSILILDEATSSVDTESEILIQNAIDKLIAGRTSIVIAHRLSTIRKASKIIVLDKGEIKEIGNHEELMKNQGFYYKLHQMQFEKQGVM
ncbi:ABC transporter ATP-binding protein [Paraflavitalea sp. CAU 1676]|uniref:ABC transporter ATP-binding protein n=1 Tax=Paraflavitalea sp. CAU 1676 TaxID=3032598 RepID=UPI0023DC1C2C|nr:ABC transporter ATP-binding protein [Paraflavitalea sp. CAU 1676]MDF2187260.1 ABC transporter ATP-binding protein [Paraflavitalea sp. CAU 1676]